MICVLLCFICDNLKVMKVNVIKTIKLSVLSILLWITVFNIKREVNCLEICDDDKFCTIPIISCRGSVVQILWEKQLKWRHLMS